MSVRSARRGRAVAVAVALTAAAPALGQEAGQLIDGILGDGDYQTELPGRPEPTEFNLPFDLPMPEIDPNWLFDIPIPDRPEAAPAGAGALADGLLWTLAVAAGLVLLAWLVLLARGRWGPRGNEAGAEPDAGSAGAGVRRDGPLRDADALAQDGNWAEAIHMLLLDGLEQLRRRARHSVPPALTSRELLRRIALPDRQSSAFAALVAAVERGHFGGRPAGYDEYQACRGHYRTFTEGAGTAPAGEAT